MNLCVKAPWQQGGLMAAVEKASMAHILLTTIFLQETEEISPTVCVRLEPFKRFTGFADRLLSSLSLLHRFELGFDKAQNEPNPF